MCVCECVCVCVYVCMYVMQRHHITIYDLTLETVGMCVCAQLTQSTAENHV